MNLLKVTLLSFGVVLLVALLSLMNRGESEDVFQLSTIPQEHPFVSCAACHGEEAEGNALLLAPRLAGQRPEYLRLQVESFQKEWRGLDEPGQMMAAAIAALDQEAIEAAIAYAAQLPGRKVAQSSLHGNPKHGEYLYQRNCVVCHGETGEGSTIEAYVPRLNILDAWYLERQLTQYRKQQRGFHPDDLLGNVMGFYAQRLPNEQAVRDVVLWLSELPQD